MLNRVGLHRCYVLLYVNLEANRTTLCRTITNPSVKISHLRLCSCGCSVSSKMVSVAFKGDSYWMVQTGNF